MKTSDIEELKSLISPNFALVNPKLVCGEAHLKQVAYLADKAHRDQYNLANDRSTEVLLYLTAQRQISKAIEIGGIAEKQKEIAWVSFDELPDKLSTVVSLDGSKSCQNRCKKHTKNQKHQKAQTSRPTP